LSDPEAREKFEKDRCMNIMFMMQELHQPYESILKMPIYRFKRIINLKLKQLEKLNKKLEELTKDVS